MFNPDTDLAVGDFNSATSRSKCQSVLVSGAAKGIHPGFNYDVKTTFLSTARRLPTFTVGAKRCEKGKSGLAAQTSTPINVGPDSYRPTYQTVSHIKSAPKIGFGGAGRFPSLGAVRRPHETFYAYSGLGRQVDSAKLSEYRFSQSRAERSAVQAGLAPARTLKVPLPHNAY